MIINNYIDTWVNEKGGIDCHTIFNNGWMMGIRLLKLVVFCAALLSTGLVYSAMITTTVDRNPVGIDESFQIIFKTDASPDGDPDFSPLEKRFHILNQSRGSNMSIMNGKVTRSEQWTLNVMAKQTGMLKIPAIKFGKDRSQAAVVEVVTGRHDAANTKEEIFIEVETSTDTPYVQAQVIYTVKLFRAVATNNASLSEPQLDAGTAVVEKLGEDRSYELQRGQYRYLVIERQYAIYPQKSGAINIAPIVFQGQIGRGNRFFIDPFGPQPRSVIKRSREVELQVKSIPASFPGTNWLPALNLALSEQWSSDPLKLNQGEPVTRTLKLEAQGLPASQLPEIKMDLDRGLKNYPDQADLNESTGLHGLIGTRIQRSAIIPSGAGEFDLPEIKIPWWNTITDKLEYAELPARTINVIPVKPVTETDSVADEKNKPSIAISESGSTTQVITGNQQDDIWKWLFFISLLLWLLTFVIWRYKKSQIKSDQSREIHQQNINQAIRELRQACKKNDPQNTKQALLNWGRLYWQDNIPASLGEIGKRCNKELGQEIKQLSQSLYGKQKDQWMGKVLLDAFDNYLKDNKKDDAQSVSGLEPLYRL